MEIEFKKNDITVEIGGTLHWIIVRRSGDGYYIKAYLNGHPIPGSGYIGFGNAHKTLVKVGRWDEKTRTIK